MPASQWVTVLDVIDRRKIQIGNLETAYQQLHALAEDADDGEKRRHHDERVRAQLRHESHDGGKGTANDFHPEERRQANPRRAWPLFRRPRLSGKPEVSRSQPKK